MEPETAPAERYGVTPHPLWLGLILLLGGLLVGLGGQWGLALLFLALSGALLVAGAVQWWQRQAAADDGP